MIKNLLLFCIRAYQGAAPIKIHACKYYPSCSYYASEAIEALGVFKGTARSLWRLLRCNPFSEGGFDPI